MNREVALLRAGDPSPDFLRGGGEMGALMRAFDWAATPVGPPAAWPQSLRTALGILLHSGYPMYIAWGRAFVQFYNDAYRPILGCSKHPGALGDTTERTFGEIWDFIGPMFRDVMEHGNASTYVDQLLALNRNGYVEECYFTFSYSAILDDAGQVGGVLVTVLETTERVLEERRARTLRELRDIHARQGTSEVLLAAAAVLATNTHDLPFARLHGCDTHGSAACKADGASPLDSLVASASLTDVSAMHTGGRPSLHVLQEPLAPDVSCPWPEPISHAVSVAIVPAGEDRPRAVLVTGLNPRKAFDAKYEEFVGALVHTLSAILAEAQAFEHQRRRAEELAELDRAKTAFFSNVSHEFRTPLTLMLGPLEDVLADADHALAPIHKEHLETAQRSSLRLLKLVNTLLDFSRIEAGRVQAVYRATDLGALTTELASNFRSACERAGLQLHVETHDLGEPAYVDRDMWEKIVLNLLSNAFKFTFDGEIAVTLKRVDAFAELCVRDTGTGIPPQAVPRLFERFYRVEGAPGRTYEGTGIGLALVQELVRLHGGRVHVESALGMGSVFTVTLPLGRAHLPAERIDAACTLASTSVGANVYVEEVLRWLPDGDESGQSAVTAALGAGDAALPLTALAPDNPPAGGATQRPRILWADDNADMRAYVRRLLSDYYEVEAVADGEAALAAMRERRPDLVLSDVMMPRLDGFALLRRLREQPDTRAVPVILLSARAGEEARVEALEAGADDYLTKPFNARELLTRVGATLRLTQLRHETEARITQTLESITDGFVLLDREWRYAYVNANAERMLRRPRAALLGQRLQEMFPKIVGTEIERQLRCVLEERVDAEFESFHPALGHWFEYRAFAAPAGAAVYFRDISARREVLQALHSSEERFRQLADAMPQIVWTARADGTLTFVNRQWQDYTGLTLEQTNDTDASTQVLHPEDAPAVIERWQRSLATGEPHEAQWRFKRKKDGAWRWFLTRAVPMRDGDDTIREWFGTATDIHEQKLAEERLRQSEQRFARFMRHLPGSAWVKDLDGRFEYVNEAAAQAWGRSLESLRDRTVADFFPPDIARQCEESDRAALRHESGIQTLETFVDANGVRRHALTSKFAIPDGEGRPAGLGGIAIDVTESKQAEERLRESEERFAKAFNASPMVLTISSLETGKLIEVNETFVRLSGYSRAEAVGHTTAELGLWASVADREEELGEVRQSGKVRNAEYRFRMRDGSEMIGLLSAERIDIGGEACTLTVIQDITERKRAEAASRANEERVRLAVAGAQMGMWDTDVASGTIYWNAQHFDILGLPSDTPSATLEMWHAHLHPEDRAEVIAAREEAMRTRGLYRVETRIVRADNGEVRWLSAHGRFVYDAEGKPTRFMGVAFDITERKRAEAALRESVRLYRAIGESIDYGVWVCDPQGRNIYASESFLRMVGITQEQCSAFGWGEVLHPDDAERTLAAWKECVASGGQWDIEHRFRGVDGKWHPVLARGVPVRNEQGDITAWAGINLDIGRLKQVEDELREAHHRKDEFLATLAHELRNPLAPIRNGLEIMRLARDNPEVTERARAMMERQLQQMVRLIDDLLDMSRISRGKVELRKEPVELAAILQSAIETSRPLIEEAGHELTISVPAVPIGLDADMTRLAQVFANLLNNAAKYTQPGGRIRLSVGLRGHDAVVRVKDNGIGIPAHMLPHVFDMFTQLDHPLEKSHGGLGIGLSIVKRLVEMHGGSVAAYSDGRGMGSEFVVRLPMRAGAAQAAAPVAPAEEETPRLRRRVLVADDHADAAASLATMLKIMGNDVRTARDGAEAADVAAVFRPELVLLDIGMPNLNGYEACRRIRGQPGGADMMIVALTGWGQQEDKRRSQEAGFDDHLVKPVEPAALEKLLVALQAR